MNFSVTSGLSPLEARQNISIASVILIAAIIAAILICIWVAYTQIHKYLTSEAYITKEMNRPTKKKDIQKISKEHNLTPENANLLYEITKKTQCTNIIYLLKDNLTINELFKKAYQIFLQENADDEKLNNFFTLLYKFEMIIAQFKGVSSSKFIPLQTVVFYITNEGEQFPMYLFSNNKDSFALEMPEFLYKSPRRPKILVRQRFNFKTKNGLSYNFVSRIMRFEETTGAEVKFLMYVGHTDDLTAVVQRHYKREFFKEDCSFSPIKVNPSANKKKDAYIYSSKVYKGIISNISAGGCCIQTPLPIKDNQSLCVLLPKLGIDEKILGVIKRTRKLPNTNLFALHIQFIKISLKSKNRIFELVYKFAL